MQTAHKAAGLVPPKRRLSGPEVLKALVRLWKITLKESGRSPFMRELTKYDCPVSRTVLKRRFGSWKKALKAAAGVAPASLTKVTPRIRTPARRKISVHTRFLVFKRDSYKCRICGRAGGVLEVDHVIPYARGGADRMANFQTLCQKCNRGKRDNLQ